MADRESQTIERGDVAPVEGDELEQLLADVRRIADGVDGFKELVVEGFRRAPATASAIPADVVDESIRYLQQHVDDSIRSGVPTVYVARVELGIVLAELKRLRGRS